MTMFRNTIAAVAVTAGMFTANGAFAYERWIDIHNVGDSTLVAVQISDIDRTDWGVLYGSGRFFRRLAGHLVNDSIELQLRLLTA